MTVSVSEDFVALVEKFRPMIYRVSRLYSADAEDRKDLEQEILLQLWRAFQGFRSDAQPGTFIYRVALNTAITRVRKVRRSPPSVTLEEWHDRPQPSSEERRVEEMYAAIARLSEVDRALVMMYLDDMKQAEIAAVLGISENNVAVKLTRIRSKLQQEFAKR